MWEDIKPVPKVAAAGFAGAIASVVVLGAVWLGAPDPPAGFEAAFATVCAFAAGWLKRS